MSRYTGQALSTRLFSKRLNRRTFSPARNLNEKLQLRKQRGRKLMQWVQLPMDGERCLKALVRDHAVTLRSLRGRGLALPISVPEWKPGMRLYFRLVSQGSVQVSRNPTGATKHGKLQSSRLKRLGTGSPIRRWRWITNQGS